MPNGCAIERNGAASGQLRTAWGLRFHFEYQKRPVGTTSSRTYLVYHCLLADFIPLIVARHRLRWIIHQMEGWGTGSSGSKGNVARHHRSVASRRRLHYAVMPAHNFITVVVHAAAVALVVLVIILVVLVIRRLVHTAATAAAQRSIAGRTTARANLCVANGWNRMAEWVSNVTFGKSNYNAKWTTMKTSTHCLAITNVERVEKSC